MAQKAVKTQKYFTLHSSGDQEGRLESVENERNP